MAAGDLVSAVYSVTTTFQPAATVVVCITQFITDYSNNGILGLGDIATPNRLFFGGTSGASSQEVGKWGKDRKFFIDNSSYLSFSLTDSRIGFSGIQTQ
jgi:hypothetical protein